MQAVTRFDKADIESLRHLERNDALGQAFEWLAGKNPRRVRLATDIFVFMGQQVVPQLTYALTRCDPELQLRLLNVIAGIDGPSDMRLTMVLEFLCLTGHPQVRDQAAVVAATLHRIRAPQPMITVAEDTLPDAAVSKESEITHQALAIERQGQPELATITATTPPTSVLPSVCSP